MAITDKINCSDIRREKSLGLVARSSLIGTLMRAGLLIAAIPLSASAQTSEEIATLKAQVAALQTTVSACGTLRESGVDTELHCISKLVPFFPVSSYLPRSLCCTHISAVGLCKQLCFSFAATPSAWCIS